MLPSIAAIVAGSPEAVLRRRWSRVLSLRQSRCLPDPRLLPGPKAQRVQTRRKAAPGPAALISVLAD